MKRRSFPGSMKALWQKTPLPCIAAGSASPLAMMLAWMPMALFISGCASNPYYNPSKPHHTPEGFRNNYSHGPHSGLLKWRWERFWDDLPKPPENGYQFEIVRSDPRLLAKNGPRPAITWIGHATLLLQVGGLNILTDPIFSERASPVSFAGPKRKVPPGVALRDLPHIDVVLISHNHFDHLDLASMRALFRQKGGPPRTFVPLGLKAWFRDNVQEEGDAGGMVVEQDWWEFSDHRGLRIHQVPAQHFSKRSLFDNDEVLWGGFMVEHPTFRFFYSGDTGYSKDFADIAARFPAVDLAVLPIGSYEPRWFMKSMHINPAEAVRIHQDLRARQSVGIHWGTFEMTDESMDEPPKALARALSKAGIPPEKFFVLKHGETRLLPPGGYRGKIAGTPSAPSHTSGAVRLNSAR